MAHRYGEHVPRTVQKYRPSAPSATIGKRKASSRSSLRPPPVPSTVGPPHRLGVGTIGGAGLQDDCSFLEVKDLFFTNLVLLGFNPLLHEEKYKMAFNRDMFDHPNRKAMEVILFFLFNKLNPQRAKAEFKGCWPIYDKKQEQQFRKACAQWLGQIAKEDPSSKLPPIAASLLLTPGGTRFYRLMQLFSMHIIKTQIETMAGPSETIAHFPKDLPKDRSTRDLVVMAMQTHIVCSQQRFVDILQEWMQTNQQLKEFASALTREYRGLCRRERELERELSVVTEGLRDRAMESLQLEVPPGRDAGQTRTAAHKTHRKLTEERAAKVEKQWKVVKEFLRRSDKQREVLDSVLSGKETEHHLDAKDIALQIPEVMLREEQQLQQILGGKNTYESGKLSVTALVRLWRHALLELRRGMSGGAQSEASEEAGGMQDCLSQQLSLHREGSQRAVTLLTEVSELSAKLDQYIETKRKELETLGQNTGEFEVLGLHLVPPSSEAATAVQTTPEVTPLRSIALPQAGVSTPEAVRHIQQSFKEASQKRALDQVTSGNPLAFCTQLLHPSQSARSKIPTKGAAKQAMRLGKKDTAVRPHMEATGTHIPSKAATQATAKKKKAVGKRRDNEETSFASVEDTSITVGREVVDSTVHRATPPSKGPLPSLVNYNFLDMSLAGPHLGVNTTVPSTHTKESTEGHLPLTTPHHTHPSTAGGIAPLSETSGVFSSPQQADGMTQDQHTAYKTPTLPKAYAILADEIVSAMVCAHSKSQKGSTGHSSRHQTPELHGVADPVSALETDAFTTRDKLDRTPPAGSQHQRPVDPANLGPSPLLSSPHTPTPGGTERYPNADSPLASHLLVSTDSTSQARQERCEATSLLPSFPQNTPPLSVTRMARQLTHDGSIHLEYRPSTSPSHKDSSPLLATSRENVDDQSLSSGREELEGSALATPPQSLPGSGSVTPIEANSDSEHTPCPTPFPTIDNHQQLPQHGSKDSNSPLQTLVHVEERDSSLKATPSGLNVEDDTPPFLRHTQREEGTVPHSKGDNNDEGDKSESVSGGSADVVEPLRHTPDVPASGEDDMFLFATPPTPFKEMSAFDDDSPEDTDILSAFRDSRRSSPGNVSEVSLLSVISSLHGGREGDVSVDVPDRSRLDASLVPHSTSTRACALATPSRQCQSFDSRQSVSVTPRMEPSSESLLLFTPAATATHTASTRTHLLPGEESTVDGILLDGAPAPPERAEASSLGHSFANLLSGTPQHSGGDRDLLTGTPFLGRSGGSEQGGSSTASSLLFATHTPSPLYGASLMNQTPSTAKGDRASALQHMWQDRSVDSPLIKGL